MDWVPIFLGTFKGTALIICMFYAIKWHYDQDKKENKEGRELQSPTEMRLFMTMVIAFILSILGIAIAGWFGNAVDGGDGGAVGCLLTFIMCIITKSDADRVLAALGEGASPAANGASAPAATSDAEVEHLRTVFRVRLESVRRERIYLGVAGLVSAISWKFGGAAAVWLFAGI